MAYQHLSYSKTPLFHLAFSDGISTFINSIIIIIISGWYCPCHMRCEARLILSKCYSPDFSLKHDLGIHSFCLIVKVLATQAKFLEPFSYFIFDHQHIYVSHMFLVASMALWRSSNSSRINFWIRLFYLSSFQILHREAFHNVWINGISTFVGYLMLKPSL